MCGCPKERLLEKIESNFVILIILLKMPVCFMPLYDSIVFFFKFEHDNQTKKGLNQQKMDSLYSSEPGFFEHSSSNSSLFMATIFSSMQSTITWLSSMKYLLWNRALLPFLVSCMIRGRSA